MKIQSNIWRESPKVCRFQLSMDGIVVRSTDDVVVEYMKANNIASIADLLKATTSSLPANVIWPDNDERQKDAADVMIYAQTMTDEQWDNVDTKTLVNILKSIVRLHPADLNIIADGMVEAALQDGRLKEA